MAWVDGRVSLSELTRNWGLVYAVNFVGAALMTLADGLALADGKLGETAAAIARGEGDTRLAGRLPERSSP